MSTDADPTRDNEAVVRRLWDAFVEGGVESMLEFADPDVEWVPRGAGGRVLRGHDELREYYRAIAGRGDVIEAEPYEFRSEGDRVVVRGYMRLRGPHGEIADDQVTWVYTMREGRLVRVEALD